MNGAESLARTLLKSGVDTCFANPGTSELHFVSALDRVPGMRCVLNLFEGVATGCADGYGRMLGKPAATLLHCGPGFANGLANLHNARRACSPIVNIVGDQATQHRPLDSNLTADTEGWARPVSAWVRTAAAAATVGSDAAVAVQAARTFPGQIATLILPADTAWDDGGVVAEPLPVPPAPEPPPHTVRQIAELLRRREPAVLFLSRKAVLEPGLRAAYRISAATGARLMAQQANPRIERGRGRVPIECLPYAMDRAREALSGVKHLILAGAARPVAVFAYPHQRGYLTAPDTSIHILARLDQDPVGALEALADELGAPDLPLPELAAPSGPASGELTPAAVGQTLAALMPAHSIVSDEGVTFRGGVFAQTHCAPPHDWMQNLGSAIGMGMPLATGAAIAAPGRRVITLQADGSAMYTLQALWTQARERLDVTTLLLANRKYAILLDELANVGAHAGPMSQLLTDIGSPDLDWIKIANGMGVEAAAAQNCEQLTDLLSHSFRTPGPFLIELAT
jgi:acetolactate synthase I/II/III large subunit